MIRFPDGCLFLSPHVDDVAFSLGAALLAGKCSAGVVVNVFSSSDCTTDDFPRRAACVSTTRKREDAAFFANVPGALRLEYLDQLDAPLRLGIIDDEVARPCHRVARADVERVRDALLHHAPPLLLAPLGAGGHIDHRVVHDAACEFARTGWATAFYEDLPYASRLSQRELELELERAARALDESLTARLLTANAPLDTVAHTLDLYRSQVEPHTIPEILEYGQRLGAGSIAERIWCSRGAVDALGATDPNEHE